MSKFYIFVYNDIVSEALNLPSSIYSSSVHPTKHGFQVMAMADEVISLNPGSTLGEYEVEYLKSRFPDHISSIKTINSEEAMFYKLSLSDISNVYGNFPR